MKVVILAGGLGTRLSEETDVRPKPMVEVGGRPILWHIMKIYSHYGFNDFVVCLGYKGYFIKDYFYHYYVHQTDVTIDLTNNQTQFLSSKSEPWKITLVDTGIDTMTGGRILRIRKYVDDDSFLMTYGDGVGNVDIADLVRFHKGHGRAATMTTVRLAGRFGVLELGSGDTIASFKEKPQDESSYVNAGFFVLEPSIFDLLENDATVWERGPLENLAARGELTAYRHHGFWKPMDALRDKHELERLWQSGGAPWKIWSD